MQQDKHPSYRAVVFRDRSAGYAFLTRSTASSEHTITWDDGAEYPVVDVEISSESHPFYTGQARVIDAEGRIAKFQRRYGEADTPIVTPDAELRTGADGEVGPEDLVLASGRDLTPQNLARAREQLEREGRVAIEKQLP